jgi:hypothetical protein
MKGNRTGKGYFEVKGSEPLAKKAVMAGLPVSMDEKVRQLAGDDLSNWIRQAVAEKLARESQ